jgi:hypothetical protein
METMVLPVLPALQVVPVQLDHRARAWILILS